MQTNLVSNVPGLAAHTDPNLRNPWGTSTGPGLPIWVSDNATGVTTLYDGQGNLKEVAANQPAVVIPAPRRLSIAARLLITSEDQDCKIDAQADQDRAEPDRHHAEPAKKEEAQRQRHQT